MFTFFRFFERIRRMSKTILKLCKVLHDNELQDLYPYADIALRLFLMIPASNCSAERSFSILKRIKNSTHRHIQQMAFLPVSYTHLDVYKRQGYMESRGPPILAVKGLFG